MSINIRKILGQGSIRLELNTQLFPPGDLPEGFDPLGAKNLDRIRDEVIGEMCDLLDASGQIGNRNRLYKDLLNREKKAVTAVGEGIAIPHVRTLQAKEFVMAFARSRKGIPFRAPDDQPVHLFFAMVSPPYEDRMYLKIYHSLATLLLRPETFQAFMDARIANDIWQILESCR